MKFKDYIIIFTLVIVLMCGVNAISAVSDDAAVNISSEIADNSISLSNDENVISIDDMNSKLSSQNDDNYISTSFEGNDTILGQNINTQLDSILTVSNSKSDLKIVNYTNFVKSGDNYYFYLTDSKGNPVANKSLDVTYNGKTYQKTTGADGEISIKVKSTKTSSSMDISFNGDSKYNKFSQKLNFYIDQVISMSIGNTKVLTNGFLRIYLYGPKDSVSNKTVKIKIGSKSFTKTTSAEGFIVLKPYLTTGNHNVVVEYGNYVVSKVVKCIKGNVSNPLKKSVPTVNGVPDIDIFPGNYVMAYEDGKYSLTKEQYQKTINRDSKCLFLYNKLSKYTFFQSKDCPTYNHVIKREKWNVIERALNTKLVKQNKYNYWPGSLTVSLKGKSYTYSEVRDVQNTEYTCGPTSASVCSQALRKYYSELYFQKQAHVTHGVNIPVLKSAIEKNGFKASYFYTSTFNSAIKQLANGGCALIAFLPNHYVSVIDVSPDGKKILVSNSYGKYNVGGNSKVPTDWVSISYFKSKFNGIGLIVKLNYKLSQNTKNQLSNFYSSMGANWIRQNVNERIPDTA